MARTLEVVREDPDLEASRFERTGARAVASAGCAALELGARLARLEAFDRDPVH